MTDKNETSTDLEQEDIKPDQVDDFFKQVADQRANTSSDDAVTQPSSAQDSTTAAAAAADVATPSADKPAQELDTSADDDKSDSTKEPDKDEASVEADWRESLPEAAKKQLAEYEQAQRLNEHKERSHKGRVAGLNRKIHEMSAQLKELEKKAAQPQEPKEVDDIKIPDVQDTDAFAKFSERYPQIAEAVREQIKAATEAVTRSTSSPSAASTPAAEAAQASSGDEQLSEADRKYLEEQHLRLSKVVPNYYQISKTPFFEEFLDQLPPKVRDLANSDDADDLIHLFVNEYGPYHRRYFPEQTTPGVPSPDTSSENTNKSTQDAQSAKQRREDKLKDTAVTARTPRPPVQSEAGGPTGDYESQFARAAAERLKKAG